MLDPFEVQEASDSRLDSTNPQMDKIAPVTSFHWDKNYITGIAKVDNQHHGLVDLINEFGNQVTSSKLDVASLDLLLEKLSAYAIFHFSEEEALMESFKLDSLYVGGHEASHRNFIEQVGVMRNEVVENGIGVADELLQFLCHWLAMHILGMDQFMAEQIRLIQAGTNPSDAYLAVKTEQEKDHATMPLLQALHGMFELVSLKNKRLALNNKRLEEEVKERTHALTIANEKLRGIAMTDALTRLPNRRNAMQSIERSWNSAVNHGSSLSCILIDADYFKQVNDNFGHQSGDLVLQVLANTIKAEARNDDLVSRLGGDEFLVECPATDLAGAVLVAERIRGKVEKLIVSKDGNSIWQGSVSIGVAERRAGMEKVAELIGLADESLYLAKAAGRNCTKASQLAK